MLTAQSLRCLWWSWKTHTRKHTTVASLKIQVLKFCKWIYKSQTSRMENLSLSESQPLQMSNPWNYEQVKTDWASVHRRGIYFCHGKCGHIFTWTIQSQNSFMANNCCFHRLFFPFKRRCVFLPVFFLFFLQFDFNISVLIFFFFEVWLSSHTFYFKQWGWDLSKDEFY